MLQKLGSNVRGVVMAAKFFLMGVALLVLWCGNAGQPQQRERRPTGNPQLISVAPLHETDGEMCQWAPASAGISLTSALQQERAAADAANSVETDRAPVRQIRDTYPTYSALAVDLQTEEVYLQDEN